MLEFKLRIDTANIGLSQQEKEIVMANILNALEDYVHHTGLMPVSSKALTNVVEISDHTTILKRYICDFIRGGGLIWPSMLSPV